VKDGATGILPFIAQVISSVAWPLTVLVCVIILKRHLLALIPFVRTVKYSDVEIRFGKEVAELAKSTEVSVLSNQPSHEELDRWGDLTKLASIRPRTAIRQAFERIENAMRECARKGNIEIADGAYGMPMAVGALLLHLGAISIAQFDMLTKLRILLNEAEHAPPDSVSTGSAADFVSLAWLLAASIDHL